MGFIGIRTRFGSRFLFEEYECSISPDFGTARATRCLGAISEGIEICETLDGNACGQCGGAAAFNNSKDLGGKGWRHTIDGSPLCKPCWTVALPNAPLFAELERYECKLKPSDSNRLSPLM